MAITVKVWDERGEELDAHCTLIDEGVGSWDVVVFGNAGPRGAFPVIAPPERTTLEAAINAELVARGIHAQNNPGPRPGGE